MSNVPTKQLADILSDAKTVVVMQADNPDGDSLATALALEQILHDQGKEPVLYCGVDIPSYLRHLSGYDRVVKELPNNFDASILVDCSTITLLEQLEKTNQLGAIQTRPMIVIDHHSSEVNLPIDHVSIIDSGAVASGEVLFNIAKDLDWPLNQTAKEMLVSSLLADSLGLTSEGTTSKSVYMLAELVEAGVSIAILEARRRLSMLKTKEIVAYKGKLLQRIEYFLNGQLAVVSIPWEEIEEFSPFYNPSMLALEELRMTEGVKISVALKTYPDGKITGKLRCNHGTSIADALAGHFGGGGHPYAAGFKTNDWQYDELRAELIKRTNELLRDDDAAV